MRPYDDNGDLEYFRRNYAPFNILKELELNYIDIEVIDLSTQIDFDVRPIKELSIKGVVQLRYANTKRDHTVHENSNQAEAYRANGTQFIQEALNSTKLEPNEQNYVQNDIQKCEFYDQNHNWLTFVFVRNTTPSVGITFGWCKMSTKVSR